MITASTLMFDPLLPVLWLAILVSVPFTLALLGAWRRVPGAWLRMLTVLILGAVLLNPALVTEQRSPLRDVALLVVDRSPSQQINTRPAQTETALKALQSKLAALPNLDVRVVESAPGGDDTKLFRLIDQALADVPESRRAGVLLISDGQVHDVPAPGKAAHYGPVHLLLTGNPDEVDRRLSIQTAPGFGIVGQSVTAVVRIEDQPSRQSESATLLIHKEDGSTEQRSVAVGRDVEISVPVSHAGLNLMALEVAPVVGDITTANNRAALMVNGVRDRLRVLLVSGFPHNGERVWRNLLKSDPAVDLVHFTILRQPHKHSLVPESELSLIPFPVHELFAIKLRQFDLVIFDRYNDRSLLPGNYLLNIADYVRQGGALLDASGSDIAAPSGSLAQTPLGSLLPAGPAGGVEEKAFRPRVSATGLRHPITGSLPGLAPDGSGGWGPWFRLGRVMPLPESQILMEGPEGLPLLLLRQTGEGRIAQLTSEQIWLWARGYAGGGPQVELLRALVHWLMKEPSLEAERLSAETVGDQLRITRHSLEASSTQVEVTLPSGGTRSVGMKDNGRTATGSLPISEPGIYRLTDGTRSTLALAGRADAPELRDQRASAALLEPLLEPARAGSYWLSDTPEGPDLRRIAAGRSMAGRNWLGLAENGGYSVSGFTTTPLLPLALVAALSLLTALWAWRREGK
jgi:hypothetical protein